jgi:ketosteroid isomerase-like protein
MRVRMRLGSSVLLACALLAAAPLRAEAPPAAGELSALLDAFLSGASRNDAAAHERFWAEELVYTSSSGKRMGKADILREMKSAPPAKAGEPTTTYTAEDVRIQQYGDTAIVAFKLVGTTKKDSGADVATYFNTGTFVKRNGEWRAVAWQATRIPAAGDTAPQKR